MAELWKLANEVLPTADEVKQLMEMKEKPVRELSDSKWLCELAFMMDITSQS